MSEHQTDEQARGSVTSPGDAEVLAATRALLWLETAADAKRTAVELVEALGGVVVDAADADGDALPVDLSFGEGGPLLPSAPPVSVAHMLLSRHLPGFVRDAHRAVELAERTRRLMEEAEVDPLTGLSTRRMIGRALGRLEPNDVVIMLDLDHFKQLNDSLGHRQGDRVLRAFGEVVRDTVRARDVAGRYGGEEFAIILHAVDDRDDADAFLTRLRSAWEEARPHPVTFSAGLATAGDRPADAMQAADEALYEAKDAGRDRWLWAADVSAPVVAAQAADDRPAG